MYNRRMYNNRFGRNFLTPFLLGGITGGLLAPSFYPRPYIVPIYPTPMPPIQPVPPFPPYPIY